MPAAKCWEGTPEVWAGAVLASMLEVSRANVYLPAALGNSHSTRKALAKAFSKNSKLQVSRAKCHALLVVISIGWRVAWASDGALDAAQHLHVHLICFGACAKAMLVNLKKLDKCLRFKRIVVFAGFAPSLCKRRIWQLLGLQGSSRIVFTCLRFWVLCSFAGVDGVLGFAQQLSFGKCSHWLETFVCCLRFALIAAAKGNSLHPIDAKWLLA